MPALVEVSPLADFFTSEKKMTAGVSTSLDNVLAAADVETPPFNVCSGLTKNETLLFLLLESGRATTCYRNGR